PTFIAQVAPRDGTAFATMGRASVIAPLFGLSAAQFDARRFSWLGSANDEVSICVGSRAAGINSLADLKTRAVNFVSTGPSEEAVQVYKSLNAFLGARIKTISGYPGSNEMNLAIERGEAGGRCALSWWSVKAMNPTWLAEKKVSVLVQVSL